MSQEKGFRFASTPIEKQLSEHATLGQKIEASLVSMLYQQARIGLITAISCATLILLGLWNSQENNLLLAWYLVFLVLSALRFRLANLYAKDPQANNRSVYWRNLFILGAFLGGVCWGVVGTALFPENDSVRQLLIILILAGITAGAVPLLSPIRTAAIAFVLPTLLPLMLNLLLINEHIHFIYDWSLIVYFLYLLSLIFKSHKMVRSSVRLRFENDSLLESLLAAKEQLEAVNKKLEETATHDPLTSVANRHLFQKTLKEALQRAENKKVILSLLYIDIDNFKLVNDMHGHYIGDQVLLIIVHRLKHILSPDDVIARIGGDEFTVILEQAKDPNAIAEIAGKICAELSKPLKVNNVELTIAVSVGISVYPLDGIDPDQLLYIADKTMYFAKEHGGNSYHFNVEVMS